MLLSKKKKKKRTSEKNALLLSFSGGSTMQINQFNSIFDLSFLFQLCIGEQR